MDLAPHPFAQPQNAEREGPLRHAPAPGSAVRGLDADGSGLGVSHIHLVPGRRRRTKSTISGSRTTAPLEVFIKVALCFMEAR